MDNDGHLTKLHNWVSIILRLFQLIPARDSLVIIDEEAKRGESRCLMEHKYAVPQES